MDELFKSIELLEVIKLIGGVLGIIAFSWRVNDALKAYLHIFLTASHPNSGNYVQLLTRVENKNKKSKIIDTAFLLITPHGSDLIDAMKKIAGKEIGYTNDFVDFSKTSDNFVQNNDIIFKKLPFYYSENVGIAEEDLTYSTLIDTTKLKANVAYEARFFITSGKRLHRSTQTSFVVKKPNTV